MEPITLLLLLATTILIGIFIFQAQQFKSKMLTENGEETGENLDPITAPDSSDPFWKNLRQVVDATLQQISTDPTSAENEQKPDATLPAMLALHHTTVLGRGVSLLQDAIRQDKAQTLLLSGDKGPVYLMALPFQGDRPNLIRQTEGFSSGLAHHIEQVFSQAQSSGKAATPLVFVAFFYKISKQKGAVYVGCRDTGTWLLPRSLLSNAEIARYPNALSNYRQII